MSPSTSSTCTFSPGRSSPSARACQSSPLTKTRPSRLTWPGEQTELHRGDLVVVEQVKGLTLCVRKADRWEIEA